MRLHLPICVLFITFMASAATAGDKVIARVGNEAITQRELTTALEGNPDLTRQKTLDLLIERRLVLVWAAGKRISIGDEELKKTETSIREKNNLTEDAFQKAVESTGQTMESFRANLLEQLTINKALGIALATQTQISENELNELYLATYPRKTVFDVSHILLAVEKEASAERDAAIKQNAEQVLDEISRGASFDGAALKYSQDTSTADKGGRLGIFNEGELLPELEKLAATLEPGEVGGPVKTSAGYHILKLESKKLSEPPPLVEVRGALERELMARKEESVRTRWLNELKETTYIEVFPDDG